MHRKVRIMFVAVFMTMLLSIPNAWGSGSMSSGKEAKTAIVIAHFGTTVPSGLEAILNINQIVQNAYPGTEVRTTFTSNMIRKVWKKRQAEPQKWLDQGIPEDILYVKNIIATIGDLLEDGYTNIIVQPSHMFFMEQSHDLKQYVNALGSIRTMKERWKPFTNIVMGRPALGMPGDVYSYHEDVDAVVATLAEDLAMAEKANATLLYMGHGNEHWSTGIYAETEKKIREVYPTVDTYIGVVEGSPSLDDLMLRMKNHVSNKKIIIKPFMIVAGDHATNDMAGPEEDSWKSILSKAGYEVEPVLKGLGSNPEFARLFVDHIADAAKERGITLQ